MMTRLHWLCLGLMCLSLTGCRSTRPEAVTDPDMATAATAARRAFEYGKTEQAATLYERALARARALDDPSEIANNAYNLGACLVGLGRLDEAEGRLLEASRAADRAGTSRGEILLLQARLAQLDGDAERAVDALLLLRKETRESVLLLQADILESELAMESSAWNQAAERVEQLERAMRRGQHDVLLRAQVAGLSGRLAVEHADTLAAARAFDRQADYFQTGGKSRDMAMALGAAAAQYAARDAWASAWDRSFRSARSLLAQGNATAAQQQVALAVKAGQRLGDPDAEALTADLFESIREALAEDHSEAHE